MLAALLALLLAWFALVRPAVKSTAKQAATEAAQEEAARGEQQQGSAAPGGPDDPAGGQGQGQGTGPDGQGTPGGNGGSGTGPGTGTGPGGTGTGGTQQSSATIDVESQAGGPEVAETYKVPQGKVFGITDLVVANFQGDEGVLTISFGERKITTIALETFRNQDYHWVTPFRFRRTPRSPLPSPAPSPALRRPERRLRAAIRWLTSAVYSAISHGRTQRKQQRRAPAPPPFGDGNAFP